MAEITPGELKEFSALVKYAADRLEDEGRFASDERDAARLRQLLDQIIGEPSPGREVDDGA